MLWKNFIVSLKIMGQGMFGIFAAILLIMLVIFFLSKLGSKNKPAE